MRSILQTEEIVRVCARIRHLTGFLTGRKGYILEKGKTRSERKIINVCLIVLFCATAVAGERTFYDDAKRGWFWFEKPPVKARKKKRKKVVLTPEYLGNLTAKEFRQLYSRVKDEAVMHPTQQNIHAFLYLTDYMRRKSKDFMYAYQNYILQHPEYDMNRVSGTTSWSWRAAQSLQEEKMKQYIRENANNIGLFFFASAGCRFCEEQAKVLHFLMADYDIAVKTITDNACSNSFPSCSVKPGLFEKFYVQVRPEIVLVYRGEGQVRFAKLSSGLITEERLFKRIYLYLRYFKTGKWEINSLFEEIGGGPPPKLVLREER